MTVLERLLAAMHTAGGETIRTPAEWVELAQSHNELLEAVRRMFGKRLPTPQRFGLWASQHLGAVSGELLLHGKYAPGRRGWVYRVISKARLEQLTAEAATKRAAADAELQRVAEHQRGIEVRRRVRAHEAWKKYAPTIGKEAREPFDGNLSTTVQPPPALAELAPAAVSGPIAAPVPQPLPPSHGDEFLTEVKYDSTGVPRRVPVRGRDGLPLKAHPTAPAKPEAPAPVVEQRPDPNREPEPTAGLTPPDTEWFSGCGRPRSVLERFRLGRAAGQGRVEHSAPGSHFQDGMPRGETGGEYGYDDPGGIVTQNINGRRCKWSTAGDWGL